MRNRRIVVPEIWRIGARALLITMTVLPFVAMVSGGDWAGAFLVMLPFDWLSKFSFLHWFIAVAIYMIVSLVVAVGWESGRPLYRYSASLLLSYLLLGAALVMNLDNYLG
jgi:hypothetical protein